MAETCTSLPLGFAPSSSIASAVGASAAGSLETERMFPAPPRPLLAKAVLPLDWDLSEKENERQNLSLSEE